MGARNQRKIQSNRFSHPISNERRPVPPTLKTVLIIHKTTFTQFCNKLKQLAKVSLESLNLNIVE